MRCSGFVRSGSGEFVAGTFAPKEATISGPRSSRDGSRSAGTRGFRAGRRGESGRAGRLRTLLHEPPPRSVAFVGDAISIRGRGVGLGGIDGQALVGRRLRDLFPATAHAQWKRRSDQDGEQPAMAPQVSLLLFEDVNENQSTPPGRLKARSGSMERVRHGSWHRWEARAIQRRLAVGSIHWRRRTSAPGVLRPGLGGQLKIIHERGWFVKYSLGRQDFVALPAEEKRPVDLGSSRAFQSNPLGGRPMFDRLIAVPTEPGSFRWPCVPGSGRLSDPR